jgi:hypothetical protein
MTPAPAAGLGSMSSRPTAQPTPTTLELNQGSSNLQAPTAPQTPPGTIRQTVAPTFGDQSSQAPAGGSVMPITSAPRVPPAPMASNYQTDVPASSSMPAAPAPGQIQIPQLRPGSVNQSE